MPPKSKSETLWSQCETCNSYVTSKEIKNHSSECSLNIELRTCNFIKDEILHGTLDLKSNEEIKNISTCTRDMIVFVSQSVLQLLSISIGDWVVLNDYKNNLNQVARIVWPTNEKSCTSILLTKNSLNLSQFQLNTMVSLNKLRETKCKAHQVSVIVLTGAKNLDISPELQNRLQKLFLNKYLTTGNRISIIFYGKTLSFEVKNIEHIIDDIDVNEVSCLAEKISNLSTESSKQIFYKITDKTMWNIYRNNKEYIKVEETIDPFNKIGGLDDEIDEIEQLMNMVLTKNEHLENLPVCRAILIYGSSGTGKSLLLEALKKSTTANVFSLTASELFIKNNSIEETINDIFDRAIKCVPSLILIDEVDMLCPNRTQRLNDNDKKIISALLRAFDKLNDHDNCRVFVLGATNKLDNLDASFRRHGRFDREIEIPTPNANGRFAILKKILNGNNWHSMSEEEIRDIANVAHGFVGADLVSLCSMASLYAYKNNQDHIEYCNLQNALKHIKPSAMREVQVEVPNVKWCDVGGLHNLKLILQQCVEWPLKHADCFVRLGITPPKGVLMFGPPGCSKTMVAKALATESGLNFLSIKGPELFSKWVGESERAVREVFRKARNVAPSIIFFDEIDALGSERTSGSTTSVQERVLAQLLTELDGISPLNNVIILAATNRPDRIDKALLRPGRLDKIIYMPLPDESTRCEILDIKLAKMPTVGVEVTRLVEETEGYSGAEINAVCHEAALRALTEDINSQKVYMRHFQMALQIVTRRTPKSLLNIYEKYLADN